MSDFLHNGLMPDLDDDPVAPEPQPTDPDVQAGGREPVRDVLAGDVPDVPGHAPREELPDGICARDGRITGVFSTEVMQTVGFGSTKKKVPRQVHYFVEEQDDGSMRMQPLNSHSVPSGDPFILDCETLLAEYLPDPVAYAEQVRPAMEELEKTITRGERHRQRGETYTAEHEFKNALRVDEANIRATFGLGLTYLDRREQDKGELVFRRLLHLHEAFEERHKHLFNEFGIQLRRNKMFIQALKYYARAHKLTQEDEHLFYNIARCYYGLGRFGMAAKFLQKALSVRPEFTEAAEFLAVLNQHGGQRQGGGRSEGALDVPGPSDYASRAAKFSDEAVEDAPQVEAKPATPASPAAPARPAVPARSAEDASRRRVGPNPKPSRDESPMARMAAKLRSRKQVGGKNKKTELLADDKYTFNI